GSALGEELLELVVALDGGADHQVVRVPLLLLAGDGFRFAGGGFGLLALILAEEALGFGVGVELLEGGAIHAAARELVDDERALRSEQRLGEVGEGLELGGL